MLLALFLLAAQPARVVVPEQVRKQRAAEEEQKPPSLPLFADPRLAEALGSFDAHPGAWAEYAVLPKKGPQARLKIAVLGPALPDGRYWLEAQSQQQGGPPVAMKMLLHGPPGRLRNLERLYVFVEGLAPMEFPVEDVAPETPSGALPDVRHLGTRKLNLKAGAFVCDELEVSGTRVFRSAQVPLWGLVRAVDEEQRIELTAFSQTGAESVFPREFDQGKGSESTK